MDITVSPEDVAGTWRPLSPAESATIARLSARAWTRIQADVLDITDKLQATPQVVTEATVKDVMVSMIIRVLKNPDSARQISKSADDWSKSVVIDGSVSTGELYLTDYERALLSPRPAVPEYGLYVVGLGG